MESLDLEEVDKEMAMDEAAQSSAPEGDAPVTAIDAPAGEDAVVCQVFWPFYIRPYFALKHGFLAAISLFVNDLLLTHDHLDELGYSLSVFLICYKVLVPFLFLLSFFVDSSIA